MELVKLAEACHQRKLFASFASVKTQGMPLCWSTSISKAHLKSARTGEMPEKTRPHPTQKRINAAKFKG